ncbi:MAG: N-6 DNA methylase, partial [Cyanobacteria bacterium J06639_18]
FSNFNFKKSNLAQSKLLENLTENLIKIYALNGGMKGGDSSTPPQVAKLLVRLAEPSENMKICDPLCGSGSLLVECINQIKNTGGNSDNISLYGQEINYHIWSLAKINLLLHNINKFDIRPGDSIRNPQLVDEHGNLINFDRVIANPPLNLKDWGNEIAETDIYGRFHYGIPPKNEGNFAFIQHILAILNKTGKASVLMSQGILINEGLNVNIRKNIIEEDLIEAVVALPSKLLYNSSISPVILVFNRNKIRQRKNKILLIDASQEYKPENTKNYLQDENIDKIFSTYNKFQNQDGYANIVSIEELALNNYIINIKQHTNASLPKVHTQIELSKQISKLHKLEAERSQIESEINRYIRTLGRD